MGAREDLVDAGLRLLEHNGPESLNARKLAAEIGTSTMAVYTHFHGMAGLYEAMMRESFVRFGHYLDRVPRTADPVTDLLALGLAYRGYALANPQRYRFMFGITAPGTAPQIGHDLTTEGTPTVMAEVNETYEQLVAIMRRVMAAGRIREDDPVTVAGQLWSVMHGYVLLEMTGVFGTQGQGVLHVLGQHTLNLLVGLGDKREAAEQSLLELAARPDFAESLVVPPAPPAPGPRRGRRPGPGAS